MRHVESGCSQGLPKEPNVHPELVDLDEADGWISLVNLCEEHRGTPVVFNTAARNNLAVSKYGRTLDPSFEELGRDLVMLWVSNRRRDSVELLKEFMDALPRVQVHVARNGYFRDEKKFEIFNTSKVHARVEERGGRIRHPARSGRSGDRRHLRESPLAHTSGQDDAPWQRRRARSLARGGPGGALGAFFGESAARWPMRIGDADGEESERFEPAASALCGGHGLVMKGGAKGKTAGRPPRVMLQPRTVITDARGPRNCDRARVDPGAA
jgi:hypothetical protein